MDRLTATARFEDTVAEGYECPKCGEARVDWLIMSPQGLEAEDDSTVKCATCETVYRI